MTRRRDLFARLSLDYADHPKIAGLSDTAFRAHVEMILYSRRYLTDGQIAKQIAKRWPEHALSELLANDDDAPSLSLTEKGDYLIHGFEEMQETRAEVDRKRQIRADAGRLGGLAKGKQSAKRSSGKLLSKNVAETETETETEITTSASTDVEREFAEWYSQYPRKRGKGQALKAYRAARKKVDAETLLEALENQTSALTAKGAEYVPYPATWLNGERWDDEDDNNLRRLPATDARGNQQWMYS